MPPLAVELVCSLRVLELDGRHSPVIDTLFGGAVPAYDPLSIDFHEVLQTVANQLTSDEFQAELTQLMQQKVALLSD